MPNKLIGRVVLGDHDRELVFEFFALVMSFEWALKRFGWLIDSNPGARAEAGWKEYAETLRGRLLVRPEIATAIALLREHPPKEQCVTEDHQLGWREVRHEAGVSDEWRMLHLVKTVRNNLFHGGKYHLYKYRKYRDVRLVFAPEFEIAFFGGDPDNFEYPRYDLDMAVMRVYEDGKPASTPAHFAFNPAGPRDGELTFVSGHPGTTERLRTVAELAFTRDVAMPFRLLHLAELRGTLNEFARRGAEPARVSQEARFSVENSLKARRGMFDALLAPEFFPRKQAAEQALAAKS